MFNCELRVHSDTMFSNNWFMFIVIYMNAISVYVLCIGSDILDNFLLILYVSINFFCDILCCSTAVVSLRMFWLMKCFDAI